MRVFGIAAIAVVLVSVSACSNSVQGDGKAAVENVSSERSSERDNSSDNPGSAPSEGGTSSATEIDGVVHREFPSRDHEEGTILYDQTPPFGGPHSPEWADCMGTFYNQPIPDENAVHSLEHGAVWITYRADLFGDDLEPVRKLVEDQPYTFASPYEINELVTVQAWGYQLRADDLEDPRIAQFITKYRQNSESTPELGATCSNSDFLTDHT